MSDLGGKQEITEFLMSFCKLVVWYMLWERWQFQRNLTEDKRCLKLGGSMGWEDRQDMSCGQKTVDGK